MQQKMKKKEKSGWKEKSAETGKNCGQTLSLREAYGSRISYLKNVGQPGKGRHTHWDYGRALLPEDMGCAGTDPLGIWLYREFLKRRKEKEQEFQKQFHEMIQSLSAALNTGYSVEKCIL